MATLMICSYCGGRVVWHDGYRVHATTAPRIPRRMLTPGDYASPTHNYAGTRVGGHDIISVGGVKRYLVDTVGAYADDLSALCLPYSLPAARGGTWTVRQARGATAQ